MEGPLGSNNDIPYVSLDDEVEKIERTKSESVTRQVRLEEDYQEEEDENIGSDEEVARVEGGSARFRRSVKNRKRRSKMSRSASLEPPRDLESRHQALNALGFGFKPFVNHVAKKPLDERSEETRELYLKPTLKKDVPSDNFLSFGNLLWVFCFGWWLSLTYIILSGFLFITIVGIPYAKLCWQLHSYFFWPFGKFIIRAETDEASEELPLKRTATTEESTVYGRTQGRSKAARIVSAVIWYMFAVPVLVCAHAWTWIWCWELVITIPMAKINSTAIKLLFSNPLQLSVTMAYPRASANVVLFTFQSINFYYVRYSVSGMNIMIVNLFPFVLLTLALGFLIPESHRPNEVVLFFFALVSIVPLAYYIGMAVSSISAQSSLALGAVLNASFGSIVELILYWTAIAKGQLGNFVQASITGSLLCTMLLIPGASMVAGGIKHKEQLFNQISAGVSSVLLIFSLVGAFIPTIFYSAYGSYSLSCTACLNTNYTTEGIHCTGCNYAEVTLAEDTAYTHGAKPLMYAVSIVLPLAYLIGLFFTLKTHAAYILKEAPKEEKGGGHDAPEWNKFFCVVVLIVCTGLFAGISELLSQSVENFKGTGLTQEFVGVALVGVFGNAAELINAVSFGLKNNIALSLEIGNAGTIQTALIQIPGLVLFSAILMKGNPQGSFIMIFPSLDLFAIIFSVLILNYISINGKTNYFEGMALLLVYAVLILSFFFVPENVVTPENTV